MTENCKEEYTGAIFALLVAAVAYLLFVNTTNLAVNPKHASPAPIEQSVRRFPWFPWFPRKEHDGKR